ncbi:MAG TPA: ABC transporter ATP-binding protein [Vicinamibacterales bacterium]|nr:ABC transporter ATP-binding protein [Vicinamibacterales bacterium]HOG29901.1 ABC transporter ATP-binding protein [Vicinamibacterales bacterium]HPW21460.1 ABC transporter ATP-binding protein [Vicinamibacterales bacterium]
MALDFDRVVAEEVSRSFGRRRALSRVSMVCEAGRIVGLLGPNGAGKSTLLAVLSTLLPPSSGRVRYGSHEARTGGPAVRARIGLLGHDLYLYPDLTARENLAFFARLYGLPDAGSRVAEALRTAGLESRGDDVVSGFSRGMRQRLALERALLHGPRLLLLDEPFTGLDEASGAALVARLRGLKSDGAIVVLATHDLDLAERVLDEALVLGDGRVRATAPSGGQARERYREALRATAPSGGSAS